MLLYPAMSLSMSPEWFLLLLLVTQMAALLLDRMLGEPTRFHPLVGFGYLSQKVERVLNAELLPKEGFRPRLFGCLAWVLLTLPLVATLIGFCMFLGLWSTAVPWAAIVVFGGLNFLILYLAIGLRSLVVHARDVALPMINGDLPGARARVAYLVSRETEHMAGDEINRACIESVLENGNDAVVGALFWFVVAAGPGVLLYRLANTLDACWGYRSPRYRYFGWFSARADDVMNYIPARICALSYAFCGNCSKAIQSWRAVNNWRRTEGRGIASPNAGPVMAAGAGALQIQLGGAAIYDGVRQVKPSLGSGRDAMATDIFLSLNLVCRAVFACLLLQALCLVLLWGIV